MQSGPHPDGGEAHAESGEHDGGGRSNPLLAAIESLRYLVYTRPDITFVVEYMSQFMERPTMEHLQAIKRILRYVTGTLDYGLHYGRAPTWRGLLATATATSSAMWIPARAQRG